MYSFHTEYLTRETYKNASLDQQRRVEAWFANFFQHRDLGVKEPVNQDGIRLFIVLGLFHPRTSDSRCMGSACRHCLNKIGRTELCNTMIRLWEATNDASLQGQDLLLKLYELAQHFVCEKDHHRESTGTKPIAEQLALYWHPSILQFRKDVQAGVWH